MALSSSWSPERRLRLTVRRTARLLTSSLLSRASARSAVSSQSAVRVSMRSACEQGLA